MTAPQKNPLTIDRFKWDELGARLILAHLDPDRESKVWYREAIRQQSGISREHFQLADATARLFADGYRTEAGREKARKDLTIYGMGAAVGSQDGSRNAQVRLVTCQPEMGSAPSATSIQCPGAK